MSYFHLKNCDLELGISRVDFSTFSKCQFWSPAVRPSAWRPEAHGPWCLHFHVVPARVSITLCCVLLPPVHLTLASGHRDSLSAWRPGWRESPWDRGDPGGPVKERESGMWLQGSEACVEKRTPGQWAWEASSEWPGKVKAQMVRPSLTIWDCENVPGLVLFTSVCLECLGSVYAFFKKRTASVSYCFLSTGLLPP